jgi:hypothetical protein
MASDIELQFMQGLWQARRRRAVEPANSCDGVSKHDMTARMASSWLLVQLPAEFLDDLSQAGSVLLDDPQGLRRARRIGVRRFPFVMGRSHGLMIDDKPKMLFS